jgi:hypothetical protein
VTAISTADPCRVPVGSSVECGSLPIGDTVGLGARLCAMAFTGRCAAFGADAPPEHPVIETTPIARLVASTFMPI